MGLLLQSLDRLLPDPQASLVFEIGDGAVIGARRSGTSVRAVAERRLPETDDEDSVTSVAPLHRAVSEILAELAPIPSPHVAVLLPDSATRIMVFEFEKLPLRTQELRRAVEERFGHSLPFDPNDVRIAFRAQGVDGRNSILATAASVEFVRMSEGAFEEAGLLPGYVGPSTTAALNLIEPGPMALLMKMGRASLTMVAVEHAAVRLVRRIAVADPFGTERDAALNEILADLFPTLVYIEENLGTSVSRLLLSGFGDLLGPARTRMESEFAFAVDPLLGSEDSGSPWGAGLMGYVHG